ncbi:hypothetical protein CO683_36450 [Bradyrhizobium ottawaense]|uniref:hypothetical protein n=1 Tax=Bradyrhizobium ottawaense TaxID=931866 RepID=UPI000BE79E22|nr:hypothetical protein [Bradyrhizobium ottawaense]PDT64753.1 hypothetical protein CO683_36450 [Bradyrhizobium ottawaense]
MSLTALVLQHISAETVEDSNIELKSMTGHTVPEIERIEVDLDRIAQFNTESDFTGLAVSLMVETASYCCIAAGTLGRTQAWGREMAAVAGNMVRQYKLLDSYLDKFVNTGKKPA